MIPNIEEVKGNDINLANNEKNNDENEKNKALLFPQIQCVLTASISQFICGSVGGWSGSALTKMDSDFTMHSTEYSLVAATTTYGALIGSILSGIAVDFLGRKNLMLITAPMAASGWVAIALATHLYLVYLGRFVCGLAIGILFNCGYIYISETCEANLRGRLSIISSFILSLGVLAAFTLPGFVGWRASALILIIPNVIFFVALCFVPKTPYFYLLKGNEEGASKSLLWLRGSNYDIKNDLKNMILKMQTVNTKNSYKELLKRRSLLPLAIALYVQTVQQVSGASVVILYLTKILNSSMSSTDTYMAAIYIGISQLFGTLIAPFFIDKHGRRTLLILSGGLLGSLSLIFGGYFLCLSGPHFWPKWTPLAILIGIFLAYSLGVRPIPFSYPSEIFNTSARSVGCSVSFLYNRILSVIVIQFYPYAEEAYGNSTIFFGFGIMSLLCVVGTYIIVPETKRKTLEEMQDYFETRSSKTKNTETTEA